jgi:hypothetical protein
MNGLKSTKGKMLLHVLIICLSSALATYLVYAFLFSSWIWVCELGFSRFLIRMFPSFAGLMFIYVINRRKNNI